MSGTISVNHNGLNLTWKITDEALADHIVALITRRLASPHGSASAPKLPKLPNRAPNYKVTDELLLEVAEIYESSDTGMKYKALRSRFPGVGDQRIGQWITLCRKAGLIPESQHPLALYQRRLQGESS